MWWLRRAREEAEQLDGLSQPTVDHEGKQTVEQIELAQQPTPPSQHGPGEHGGPPAASAVIPTAAPSFVYALGRVDARFPSLALEKEFAQVTGRTDTAGQTDRQALHSVLTERANRYLARQMCYVFTIEGLETYILIPRDPADFELLIDAIRPNARATDTDVVIGVRGLIAPPETCNGLMVPIVAFDQLYSFDRDELIGAIPRPEKLSKDKEEQFQATAGELFDRIMQMADNAGATDEHRALNYLAVRYPAIYARAAEAHDDESTLTAVDVRPSRLSSSRKIVDVVFSYTHRRTDVTEKSFVRVDVTEEFPFLVTKLTPYYER
jgi:PatG C-terminal